MNWKKFWITFVVLYVTGGILNMLIHMVWLGSTYQALTNVWRADMDKYMWIQWVTPLFYTFFFIYIFAKGLEGKGLIEGVKFGLIIWGFTSIPMIYGQFMVYPLPYHLVLKWLFADLVVLQVMGILTAIIYRPAEKQNS